MLGEPTTPQSLLDARRLRLMVQCEACHHQQDADLKALVAAGRGDVPLAKLRFRCSRCGSRKTDWQVAARRSDEKPSTATKPDPLARFLWPTPKRPER